MRGKPLFNYRAFRDATERLSGQYRVINPHELDYQAGLDTTLIKEFSPADFQKAMKRDIYELLRADLAIFLPGWTASEGAKTEFLIAKTIGLPCYLYAEIEDTYDPQGNRIPGYRLIDLNPGEEPFDYGTYRWGNEAKTVHVQEFLPGMEQMAAGEVRVTDPTTGGQKGKKLERYDLLPVEPLAEVARLYGKGAEKYADRNWEKGYAWSLSYAAMLRHANKFWAGEDIDPETQRHHLSSVVFHALALMEYGRTHPEKDDRPK